MLLQIIKSTRNTNTLHYNGHNMYTKHYDTFHFVVNLAPKLLLGI